MTSMRIVSKLYAPTSSNFNFDVPKCWSPRLLLEDVDAIFVERHSADKKQGGGVSFSGLLNALDGVASQEGCVHVADRRAQSTVCTVNLILASLRTRLPTV